MRGGGLCSVTSRAVTRVVVLGAGMAAASLVEALVTLGAPDGALQVTVVGAEPELPYNKVMLTSLLAGPMAGPERSALLAWHPAAWYERHGVTLLRSTVAVSLDLDRGAVALSGRSRHGAGVPGSARIEGSRIGFDVAVLALGARPVLPRLRGDFRRSVVVPRSLSEVHRLATLAGREGGPAGRGLGAVGDARGAVVIGGGPLGIESAAALARRGLPVRLVHGGPHLLSGRIDGPAAMALRLRLQAAGAEVLLGRRVVAVSSRPDGAVEVLLDDGEALVSSLTVVACGTRPATGLARRAGLATGRGIVVGADLAAQRLRPPGAPGPPALPVYALGACAEIEGRSMPGAGPGAQETWAQASVLAERLCGGRRVLEPELRSLRLRSPGVDLALYGDPSLAGPHRRSVEVRNDLHQTYRHLVVEGDRVVAGVLVGDVAAAGALATAVQGTGAPSDPDAMLAAGRPTAGRPTAGGLTAGGLTAGRQAGAGRVTSLLPAGNGPHTMRP